MVLPGRRPTCLSPKRFEGPLGWADMSVSILFPKMTHILTPRSVGTGADSVQGLGGEGRKAVGMGHSPSLPQFPLCVILVSASSLHSPI